MEEGYYLPSTEQLALVTHTAKIKELTTAVSSFSAAKEQPKNHKFPKVLVIFKIPRIGLARVIGLKSKQPHNGFFCHFREFQNTNFFFLF